MKIKKGLIDTASVSGVAGAFTYDHFNDWPQWTLQAAVEVTSALCNDYTLQVAPGPGPYYGAHGLTERIMLPLAKGGLVFNEKISTSKHKEAEEKSRNWVRRNSAKVQRLFKDELFPDANLQAWLDRAISHFWVDHSRMLGGLFNPEFITELAHILSCTPKDLNRVWELSCDLRRVADWSSTRPNSEDFEIARNAYVLSALLRGRYHDHIAEQSKRKIMHHPFRRNAFLPRRKEVAQYSPTNSEVYLTSILLTSAFSENKTDNRIALWTENLIKARSLVSVKAIDLSHKDNDSIAKDHIISVFKRNNFRTYGRNLALGLDVVSSLIISTFTFGLCGWLGVPPQFGWLAGPTATFVSKKKSGRSIGKHIAHKATMILPRKNGHAVKLHSVASHILQGFYSPVQNVS